MLRFWMHVLLVGTTLGCGGTIVEIPGDRTSIETTEPTAETTATTGPAGGGNSAMTPPSGAGNATTAQGLSVAEKELVEVINDERAGLGLSPLALDPILGCSVRRHSDDIGPKGICGHAGSDGSSPSERVQECGGSNWSGEIVACGQSTPRGAVDAWLSSPGHRAHMLNPDQRTVGVAMTSATWTAIFGQ